jgi:hypothetical protein
MRCRKLGYLALAALLFFAALKPAPARASDATTPLLISAGVAGGVALIVLIAIVFTDRDEDPFLDALVPLEPHPEAPARERTLRYGPDCANAAGGPALLCW